MLSGSLEWNIVKFKPGQILILIPPYADDNLYYIDDIKYSRYIIGSGHYSSEENDNDLEVYTDVFSL
jgi:hypothetical protein